jgi:hypothetical protein
VVDWKQYGHKHDCQADTLTDRRAIFATVTIDLLRLLGQHALFTNEEEAVQLLRSPYHFITTVCILKPEAAPVPVGSVRLVHSSFVLSQSHNIWSVTHGVKSLLQIAEDHWNGAEHFFKHGREDHSEVLGKGVDPNTKPLHNEPIQCKKYTFMFHAEDVLNHVSCIRAQCKPSEETNKYLRLNP